MPPSFRDLACPACGSAPLRELGVAGRMVCDHCNGMMLAPADFESSLASTSGAIPRLVVEERTMRRCPRCTQILMSAQIVCAGTELPQAVNVCERDGVWLDAGMLEAMLEELGRVAHTGPVRVTPI